MAEKHYGGEFRVRIPPQLHRNLAMMAAEQGVSLNRLASVKLAALRRLCIVSASSSGRTSASSYFFYSIQLSPESDQAFKHLGFAKAPKLPAPQQRHLLLWHG